VRYLSEDEEARLLAVCSPDLSRLIRFALNTGLRKSALLGLRWREIDLTASVMTIPASRAKNKKDSHHPLNGAALSVLQELADDPLRSPDGLVFHNGKGHRETNLGRRWRAVLK